jgi:hypothetical protein
VIYYLRDETLYSYTSNDFGASFVKSSKGTPLSRQYICVQYKSNSPYEHIQAAEIPASFVNSFRLMFTHETVDQESGLNTDEMRSIITTDLKLLKKQVVELKEAQKVIFDNMKALASSQQNMEQSLLKEISKIVIGMKPERHSIEWTQAAKPTAVNQSAAASKTRPSPIVRSQPLEPLHSSHFSNLPTSMEDMKRLFADRVKKKIRLT